MKLFEKEVKIISSNGNKIILTNLRIVMTEKVFGGSYSIVIFLEDISSIERMFKSNRLFLILGCIGIPLSIYLSSDTYAKTGFAITLIISIIFILLWFFTRKHIIRICSKGGRSLSFEVERMPLDQINNFIDKLQIAKADRINHLYNN